MSDVDISRIQPGDEVLVRCVVNAIEVAGYEGELPVEVSASGGDLFWPKAEDIVSHTRGPLGFGDRVMNNGQEATVLFSDEKDTVIRFDLGGIHCGDTGAWASRLERL